MHSRRMMCEIVVHAYSIHFTTNLKPPLDALESGKRLLNRLRRDPELLCDDDRTQCILHIEGAGNRYREVMDKRLRTNDVKRHAIACRLDISRLPFSQSD